MVGLRTLERTAVFAWSPGTGSPFLATGTKVGALSDDFSSEIKLELWDLELDRLEKDRDADLKPLGSVTVDAGFNDLAWSEPDEEHPLGVLAGALDSGSVDLWDPRKLRSGADDAFISRTTKHTGAVKAVQWNPHRTNLLASVGAKGEIFIYDLHNMANPFRLGAGAARADEMECLDWNKQEKTAHILATGSSGGFVTVWDVKQKKDVLTLSNQGRKAVSAVAWDPEQSTRLATATSNDSSPEICIWSLRNSQTPERTLSGHELGVLGLSWCQQDPSLLLSCGKDNRTICYNTSTGTSYGSFTAGGPSNWAFQTKWNPHNPSLIATASFDGKIPITSTQSTNSKKDDQAQAQADQGLDGEDFFAKAQTQPQGISFTLPTAPKWAARPSSVSFGFGGKLVRLSTDSAKKSKVTLDTFSVDTSIGDAAKAFEEKLKSGDMSSICAAKIEEAKTDEDKADWRVVETLSAGKSRKKLREYLGFEDDDTKDLEKETGKLDINGESKNAKPETNGEKDDDFFSDLAAGKDTKADKSFSIHTSSESEADKSITRALMLGNFETAVDVCLSEDRTADAFMIAVCGGQKCIDKAQSAYLRTQQSAKDGSPSYVRLIASIVGKNLWDVVHNTDLEDWKSVMATLCTYADEAEFTELCEGLGDRLEDAYQEGGEEGKARRKDASFCYLAGRQLEKVVGNWIQELREQEKAALDSEEGGTDFEVHAHCLRTFVEKVDVFRQVTNFQDPALRQAEAGELKLAELYRLYTEYADMLASNGQLASAQRYLDLLPAKFDDAEAKQKRVRQATRKPAPVAQVRQAAPVSAQRTVGGGRTGSVAQGASMLPPQQQPSLVGQARNSSPYMSAAPAPAPAQQSQYAPTSGGQYAPASNTYAPASNQYAPAGYQPPQQSASSYQPPQAASGPYAQQQGMYGGYQPPQQQQQASLPPPPRAGITGTSSPAIPPPSAARNMNNWNDMPDNFFPNKPNSNSRRGTPGPQPVSSPFPNAQGNIGSPPPMTGPPPHLQSQYSQQRMASPLPPPPKAGEAPPRMTSPPTNAGYTPQMQQQQQRPTSSSAANAYAPPQQYSQQPSGPSSTLPTPSGPPPIQRGASPYQPPPSISTAAPSNRYAPAPGSQPSGPPGQRQVAPNPYAAQQSPQQQQGGYAPQQMSYGQPPQQSSYGQPPQASSYGQGSQQQAPPPPPKASMPPPRSQASGPPPSGPPRNTSAAPPPPPQQQQSLPQTPAAEQPGNQNSPARPASQPKSKYPRGDRAHIPANAQPIFDLLTPEIARVKAAAPATYKPQVDDMEKRLNILFDHLNNQDLLSERTVQSLVEVSRCVSERDWEGAGRVFGDLQRGLEEGEGGNWVVGVKRLINFGKVSKA